jgi:hypothetical protein
MASRLGVDSVSIGMVGNLSLSYGRLGLYDEQAAWATRGPRPWGAEFGGFVEVQLAYNLGLANGMRGRTQAIQGIINEVESRMGRALLPWLEQAWFLWKADLLLLAGDRDGAHTTVRGALVRLGWAPLATAFAGAFARWIAVESQAGDELLGARRLISHHREQLERFDALDRLEILCAASIIESRIGESAAAIDELVKLEIRRLPRGVPALLRRLGFLSS